MFSSADLSLAAGKNFTRINLSQAASGMILQNHRRLSGSIFSVKIRIMVCEAGYWKDYLVSNFKEQAFKKYSSRETIPLKFKLNRNKI
jgi:hypothetical protein